MLWEKAEYLVLCFLRHSKCWWDVANLLLCDLWLNNMAYLFLLLITHILSHSLCISLYLSPLYLFLWIMRTHMCYFAFCLFVYYIILLYYIICILCFFLHFYINIIWLIYKVAKWIKLVTKIGSWYRPYLCFNLNLFIVHFNM